MCVIFFFFFYFSANWQNVVLLHFGIILHTQIVWEKINQFGRKHSLFSGLKKKKTTQLVSSAHLLHLWALLFVKPLDMAACSFEKVPSIMKGIYKL